MSKGLQEEQGAAGKLAYHPPVLRVIELATDEVLGVGCKTAVDVVSGAGTCETSPCGGSIGS